MKEIFIKTPGKILDLPNGNKSVRTPRRILIKDEDLHTTKEILRSWCVKDYEVKSISKQETKKRKRPENVERFSRIQNDRVGISIGGKITARP